MSWINDFIFPTLSAFLGGAFVFIFQRKKYYAEVKTTEIENFSKFMDTMKDTHSYLRTELETTRAELRESRAELKTALLEMAELRNLMHKKNGEK
jgi:predicted nuclease with TOPRIM domain